MLRNANNFSKRARVFETENSRKKISVFEKKKFRKSFVCFQKIFAKSFVGFLLQLFGTFMVEFCVTTRAFTEKDKKDALKAITSDAIDDNDPPKVTIHPASNGP